MMDAPATADIIPRMQYILVMGIIMAGLAYALEGDAPDLQRPPTPLPDGMPKLSPLLADEQGAPIADAAAWKERRAELLHRWQSVLGTLPKERGPLNARVLKTEDLPEFTRQHVTYQIEEGVSTDAYLLTPKTAPPPGGFPAVVVFHPTVKTHAKEPAGVECERPDRAHGPQLVKRGLVVLCPRCFIFADGADYAGNVRAMQARHPGWTGMLRMFYDGMRAADYLETVSAVNKERLACFGHSLGAKETLYAAAFDERYKAAVFSEGGIGLTFSNWEAIWYLGPQVKQPEFGLEHHQLMALIAPRGFLLLAGESADNDRSWAFIEAALPVYKLLGAPEKLGWLNHRRGHSYPEDAQRAAEGFLERCLGAGKPAP
jgi:dienelactone hydrolase